MPGPGLSYFVKMAFINGNPAIMIGNTIYLKKGSSDLTTSDSGIKLLLHESTQVMLHASLGFGVFGRRYASEWRALGYNADQLYACRKRNKSWRDETLEGQARIVGEYSMFLRQKCTPEFLPTLQMLRAKLKDTGTYGL